MRIKRITATELVEIPTGAYNVVMKCLKYGTFNLMGIKTESVMRAYQDIKGDIVIEMYET